MSVGAQLAALPIQLDATMPVPGVASAAPDLFGGLMASVAAVAVPPVLTDEAAGLDPLQPLVMPPVADGDAAPEQVIAQAPAVAAEHLLALSAALPAQTKLLVRKLGGQAEPGQSQESEESGQPKVGPAAADLGEVMPLALALPNQPAAEPQETLLTPALPTQPAAQSGVGAAPAAVQGRLNTSRGGETIATTPITSGAQSVPVIKSPISPDTSPVGPRSARAEFVPMLNEQSQQTLPEAIRGVISQAIPAFARAKPCNGTALQAAPLAPELKVAHPFFTPAPLLASEIATSIDVPVPAGLPIEPETGELMIERQLDLASGGEWLDDLAHDIARTVGAESGPMRFRLNPEHLGSLRVEITPDRGGTAIRLTADTDAARQIIADAQPRLIAEARAQGVRISETHVDLGHQPGQGDPRRQPEHSDQPQIRTARSLQDDAQDREPSDGKPTRGRSERYA
jgi:flagellar hook-length control protein FliK